MYRLATLHEFGVGMIIDVSNVYEAWSALTWWRR